MKTVAVALLFFIAMTTQAKPGAIVIHAGAGSLNRDSFTSERKRLYHATLEQSLVPRPLAVELVGSSQ